MNPSIWWEAWYREHFKLLCSKKGSIVNAKTGQDLNADLSLLLQDYLQLIYL